jgi:KDO2-lipid IV(A) lauroyltransferase
VVQGWVEGGPAARAAIESALAEGKGLITLTLHLGNYEIGLAYLSLLGVPIQVVMRPEEAEAARFQIAARARPGVTLVAAGDSEWAGLDLLLALRRGEIVAIQGDRAFGAADLTVDLFGVPLLLPAGPFRLAQASGAPILLVTMPIVGHWRYRVLAEGPLRVAPGEEGLRAVAAEFARRVEGVVARYPTQWFNFYDLWGAGGGAGPRDARGAALRGAPPAGR